MGKTYKDAKAGRGPQWDRINKRSWDRIEEEWSDQQQQKKLQNKKKETRKS